MGFFDLFRKDEGDVVDLSKELPERYSQENSGQENPEKAAEVRENLSPEEKRKRFVRRISEMIERVENISVKLYHIEQRIEVLEKKLRVNNFRSE